MNKETLISIVIPVYNEEQNLKKVLDGIFYHINNLKDINFEIIVVDDGSIDNTWNIISDYQNRILKGIRFSRNFGKESAIAAGLHYSRGDAVIVIDGDGQHPAELIPEMIKIWREKKVDIVECVKIYRGNEPFFYKIGSIIFYSLLKFSSGLDIKNSSDFKLISKKVVDAYKQFNESLIFYRGIISDIGFTKFQIPFSVKERIADRTKWSFWARVKYAINIATSYSSLPINLITYMGILTLIISIIGIVHTFYKKIEGSAVSGFTTVIILILFLGSLLMISIGIIGIYIAKIFIEVKHRPRYIIKESLNFKKE
ncbi:glycosyltransferase family 2 protein [Thermodesulfovibrio yellowstonii]|uniref:Glycosyl transferase CsbB n=1 Tax=Thermodesulfovibrio yellowstonii (strain ATCC 51303 / DSM 11347 / YP87) TaxID=289376 RepID=B5YJC2_THEYD|nr:glycosyltransferase family 2 protein [Thermodesulfovibrio yellowstonii]ACI21363.1 putative glycosyl transferase CsbB [Thermodesulfovibrio yellowstonii DSM 11347]